VGLIAGLEDVERRKILPLPRLELRPLGRPARRQSVYRLSYRGSQKCVHYEHELVNGNIFVCLTILRCTLVLEHRGRSRTRIYLICSEMYSLLRSGSGIGNEAELVKDLTFNKAVEWRTGFTSVYTRLSDRPTTSVVHMRVTIDLSRVLHRQ
jgi:hypothetical protein